MAAAAPIMPILQGIGTALSVVQGVKSLTSKPKAPAAPTPSVSSIPVPINPEATPAKKAVLAGYSSLASADRNFFDRQSGGRFNV